MQQTLSFSHLKYKVERYSEAGRLYLNHNVDLLENNDPIQVNSDFIMHQANLELSFPQENWIVGKGTLLLEQTGKQSASKITLTLNRSLEVRMLESEQAISWERKGDFIIVQTVKPIEKGNSIEIKIRYTGTIDEYRGEGLISYSMATENMLLLPKSIAWYQQIGERMLALSYPHNNTVMGFILEDPFYQEPNTAEYRVRIINENYRNAILPIEQVEGGLYEGTSSNGLFMVLGNTSEQWVDGVKVIDHPDTIQRNAAHVEELVETEKYLKKWLGIKDPIDKIYTPLYSYINYNRANIDNSIDHSFDLSMQEHILRALIDWCTYNHFDKSYIERFNTFVHYFLETRKFYDDQKNEQNNKILFLLSKIEKDEGLPGLERITAELYKQYEFKNPSDTFNMEEELNRILAEQGKSL
jgi:hypothetical protein